MRIGPTLGIGVGSVLRIDPTLGIGVGSVLRIDPTLGVGVGSVLRIDPMLAAVYIRALMANKGVAGTTRCRAGRQDAASRQASSRLLRCAPALRVTRPNVLTHRVFMAGSELPATSRPICENTSSPEVNPHILCSPFIRGFSQPPTIQRWVSVLDQSCESIQRWVSVLDQFCESIQRWVSVLDQACESIQRWVSVLDQACEAVHGWVSVLDQYCESVHRWVSVLDQACEAVHGWVSVLDQYCESVHRWVSVLDQTCEAVHGWVSGTAFPVCAKSARYRPRSGQYRPRSGQYRPRSGQYRPRSCSPNNRAFPQPPTTSAPDNDPGLAHQTGRPDARVRRGTTNKRQLPSRPAPSHTESSG